MQNHSSENVFLTQFHFHMKGFVGGLVFKQRHKALVIQKMYSILLHLIWYQLLTYIAPCAVLWIYFLLWRDELILSVSPKVMLWWNMDGAVVRAFASHQCSPGSILTWCHMWVEFVVGSPLAPRVFSEFSSFPLSTKSNIFKFQFDEDLAT